MAICPFATYRPIASHGGLMAAHLGFALHEQEGNGSPFAYFANAANQASSHFWVAKSGALEQYIDTDLESWAQFATGNATYLSCETEGFQTESLNAAQIATLARLLKWSAIQHGFPLVGPVPHGIPGFTPHCNPNGTPDPNWGNHTCPGKLRLAQMPAILAATRPPTTEEFPFMIPTGCTDIGAVSAQVREWWNFYRTDPMTSQDQALYVYCFGLPVASGGYGQNPDRLQAAIVDNAPAANKRWPGTV